MNPEIDDDVDHDTTPPSDKKLLTIAGVLLALPMIALAWVGSYARKEPVLAGFPFFIWYQFLWVFLCSGMTYAAYKLVLKARPHRPMSNNATPPPSPTGEPTAATRGEGVTR